MIVMLHQTLTHLAESLTEKHRRTCTRNADDLVAVAMEELRQEAKRDEKKTDDELGWILSYSIAVQHMCEQNEQHA